MSAVSVFTGPSLSPRQAARALPGAEILPPVARGDLHRVRERGAGLIVVIDGTFSHSLAVSPREVVDVLRDGAVVLGASSMGAVRAAECRPAGMRGVGAVYRLYRLGVLTGDDEVAVTTDPDQDHAAVSVALVNIRLGLRRARHRGLLEAAEVKALEEAAVGMFFARRNWRAVFRAAGLSGPGEALCALLEPLDVKRDDARRVLREAARLRDAGLPPGAAVPPRSTAVLSGAATPVPSGPVTPAASDASAASGASGASAAPETSDASAASGAPGDASRFARPVRYPGHDPLLGMDRTTAAGHLLPWLFGSGRFQRYVWPLAVGEPEFADLAGVSDQERPDALRERLVLVLGRMFGEPAVFAERLAAELEFLEEFDTELMRWHAVREGAREATERGLRPEARTVTAVRESVAVAHGYGDWRSLAGDTEDGRLYGALPLAWVEDACTRIALARTVATAPVDRGV